MLEQLIEHLPYLGVVLILLAGGFGLPIPEDIPLLLGGYYCGIGKAELSIMLPVAFVAVLGADMVVYALGLRYGHHVPKLPMFGKYLTRERMAKTGNAFHTHCGKTLFMGRFMPGLRVTVYFSAGVFKIAWWKVLLFDGLAAVLSVPVWILLAWHFAHDLDRVKQWSAGAQATLIALAVVAGGGILAWKWARQRRLASAG